MLKKGVTPWAAMTALVANVPPRISTSDAIARSAGGATPFWIAPFAASTTMLPALTWPRTMRTRPPFDTIASPGVMKGALGSNPTGNPRPITSAS
jgi:hypothetical protein